MTALGQALHTFASDHKVWAAVALLALDLVVGVVAAIYRHTFRFAYLADFLRTDVLGKLVPYFAFYWAQLLLPGLGYDAAADAIYAALMVALGASVTASMNDLGLKLPAPLARGEKTGAVVAGASPTVVKGGT